MSNQAKITLSYPQAMALVELCVVASGGGMLSHDAERAAERIVKTIGSRMMGSDKWRGRWLSFAKQFGDA